MRVRAVLATVALLGVPAAHGYIRTVFNFSDGSTALLKRSNVSGIPFYVNNNIAPGLQSSASGSAVTVFSAGSDPVSAIQAGLATWNAVSVSAARFLQLQTTTKGIDSTDGQNTIAVGSSTADLSVVGGALAVTVSNPTPFAQGTTPSGDVTDADIVVNPAYSFSTDGSTPYDFQAVMTHEFGHTLGDSHNGLLAATMFQAPSSANYRFLSPDEIAFISAVYPASGVQTGTIAGKVVASDGSVVQAGLVTLTDSTSGNTIGALTAQDGTYSVQVPPASYAIHVEPMVSTSLVQPANLYLSASTKVTQNFQATVLGGAAPTLVAVTAGGTATVPNLTVTAGTSALQLPYVGLGTAGATGGNLNVAKGSPTIVNGGQSVDIVLIGGGMDGTISVQALGQGITVHPGSVRVDASESFGGALAGQPLVRFTVDVAARQTLGLASLLITKGSSTFAMSGAFVLVPPQPKISSVQDAESAQTNIVPGSWVAIYGTNLAAAFRVWAASDFINGNVLPPALGGVSVQFNGTPGAVYFVLPTQINVQAPTGISGKVTVTVTNNGAASAAFTANAVNTAPSLFSYLAGGKLYAVAQNVAYTTIGDPSVEPGTVKAQAGQPIILYVNGLAPSAGGMILGSVVPDTNPVTVTIGTSTVSAAFAGLVGAGLYQVNVTVPSGLAAGNYPITVSTQGLTSPSGVTLPVGP